MLVRDADGRCRTADQPDPGTDRRGRRGGLFSARWIRPPSRPALEELQEADIPVVNLDVRVDETGLTEAFVGSDDYNAGKLCGEDLTARKPDGGSVVIVDCLDSAAVNERITGFEEAITNVGFEVTRIDTGDDYSTIPGQLREVLFGGTQPDAIMCADDHMAEQVLQTLGGREERNDIPVYSVGGSPAVKSALADLAGPDDRRRGEVSDQYGEDSRKDSGCDPGKRCL